MSSARSRKNKASQYRLNGNYGEELSRNKTHSYNRMSNYHLPDAQRVLFIALMAMSLGAVAAGQYNRVQFSSTRRDPMRIFNAEVYFSEQFGNLDKTSATLTQNDISISTTCHKPSGGSCRIDAISSNNTIAMQAIPSNGIASTKGFNAYSTTLINTVTHHEACFENADEINFHESTPSSTTKVLLIERGNARTNAQHIKHQSTLDSITSNVDVFVKHDGNIDVDMKINEVATTFTVNVPAGKDVNIVATQQGEIATVQASLGAVKQIDFAPIDPECVCKKGEVTHCWREDDGNVGLVRKFGIYANIVNDKESAVEFKTDEGSIKTVRNRV